MYECAECGAGTPQSHAAWCRGTLNWHSAWRGTFNQEMNEASPDYYTRMSAFKAGWLAALAATMSDQQQEFYRR